MQDEKIYFEDDDYIVSSKRLVIRTRGETYLVNAISEPRFEETPLKYGTSWDPVVNWQGWLFGQVFGTDPNKYIGHLRVILKVKGKEQVFAEEVYHRSDAADYLLRVGTQQFAERCSYFRNLAIAIGAAVAGA